VVLFCTLLDIQVSESASPRYFFFADGSRVKKAAANNDRAVPTPASQPPPLPDFSEATVKALTHTLKFLTEYLSKFKTSSILRSYPKSRVICTEINKAA
jgi:hypothetical protein